MLLFGSRLLVFWLLLGRMVVFLGFGMLVGIGPMIGTVTMSVMRSGGEMRQIHTVLS